LWETHACRVCGPRPGPAPRTWRRRAGSRARWPPARTRLSQGPPRPPAPGPTRRRG